ncbi:IS4 family transposase, partial [Pseudomonadota bacterium]
LSSLEGAVKQIGSSLHQKSESAWKWRDYNVVMVDGTTVLMPDTEENQAMFPQQSAQKSGLGFPIARIVGLISLSTGSVINYALSAYQGKGNGESSLFYQISSSLGAGDILLADRYYCTYAIVALMQKTGVPVLFKNHAKKKSDFRKGKRLGAKDHLIYWEKPKRKPVWMSESDYKELPSSLQIREFSINGEVYVTTLISHKQYAKKDVFSLYQERWKIELDLRTIKTNMGMEMLRCKTPEMVKKEISVYLLAYNLIRTNIAQAAKQHRVLPRLISFKAAAQLLSAAMRQLNFSNKTSLLNFYKTILKAIASTKIGGRKRKAQPRAIKRRPKAYPLLKEPRNVACERLGY